MAMSESEKDEKLICEYLLGRVSDETKREEIEERLFTDDDFCLQVELTEDELSNDFVLARLNEIDRADFAKTLEHNSDRKAKVAFTQALKEKASVKNVEEKIPEKPSIFESLNRLC